MSMSVKDRLVRVKAKLEAAASARAELDSLNGARNPLASMAQASDLYHAAQDIVDQANALYRQFFAQRERELKG